jgi:hypothetical protein
MIANKYKAYHSFIQIDTTIRNIWNNSPLLYSFKWYAHGFIQFSSKTLKSHPQWQQLSTTRTPTTSTIVSTITISSIWITERGGESVIA